MLRDEDEELGPSVVFLPLLLGFFFPGTLPAPGFNESTFGERSEFSEEDLEVEFQ